MRRTITEINLTINSINLDEMGEIWKKEKLILPKNYEPPVAWWEEDRSGLDFSKYQTFAQMLEALGFEALEIDNDLQILDFNGHSSYEKQLFKSVAHLITPGSFIFWEENEKEICWVFDGKGLICLDSVPQAKECISSSIEKYNLEKTLAIAPFTKEISPLKEIKI